MPTIKCPTCGKAFDSEQSEAMPFCSVRCQQIDLGRWLGEQYGLPHAGDLDEDGGNGEEPQQ